MLDSTIRYYVPKGTPPPAHRDDLIAVAGATLDGKGPDVASGGEGGGRILGGSYVDGEAGWERTPEGWWLRVGAHALPQEHVRLDPPRSIMRWAVIAGADPVHRWRVPVLIQVAAGDPDRRGAMFVSALERTWRGEAGWQEDASLKPVQEQLLRVSNGLALHPDPTLENVELVEVVLKLFELGHRLTRHEIAQRGWLTERVLLRAVTVAAGIVPADVGSR